MAFGKKTGGRKKGSLNRRTILKQRALGVTPGLLPLEYMLSIMRNPKARPQRRLEAAKAAAPFVHPRLQTTTIAGDANAPVKLSMEIAFVKP